MTTHPKYVLHPGKIISQRDGQRHYVGAQVLAMLYKVPMCECVIHEPKPWWPESFHRMAEGRHRGLVALYPKYDGNYELHPNQHRALSPRLLSGNTLDLLKSP